MQEAGSTTDLRQPRSDRLYLEECRPMIVRALVYDGMSVASTAELFGLLPTALVGVLKLWEVHVPVCITQALHRIWFRRKTEKGSWLPKPLRMINRSDLLSMWNTWEMDSLCAIWSVEPGTMEAALEFHCFFPPLFCPRAATFLDGSPQEQAYTPPRANDCIFVDKARVAEQREYHHRSCAGSICALNDYSTSVLL